jgi:hypothetical protein
MNAVSAEQRMGLKRDNSGKTYWFRQNQNQDAAYDRPLNNEYCYAKPIVRFLLWFCPLPGKATRRHVASKNILFEAEAYLIVIIAFRTASINISDNDLNQKPHSKIPKTAF